MPVASFDLERFLLCSFSVCIGVMKNLIKTDIFPDEITDPSSMRELEDLNFQSIMAKNSILPFVFHLNPDEKSDKKVRFFALKYGHRIKFHFDHLENRFHRFEKEKIGWHHVYKRLIVGLERKNNSDRRLSFKFDKHYFVVKKFFTTGVREVEEGLVHCYQVGPKDIYVYIIAKETAKMNKIETKTRIFIPEDRHHFLGIKMNANTTYILPPNIYYVICTYSNAYFSIFKFSKDSSINFKYSVIPSPPKKNSTVPENSSFFKKKISDEIIDRFRASQKSCTSKRFGYSRDANAKKCRTDIPETPLIEHIRHDNKVNENSASLEMSSDDSDIDDFSNLITFNTVNENNITPPPPLPVMCFLPVASFETVPDSTFETVSATSSKCIQTDPEIQLDQSETVDKNIVHWYHSLMALNRKGDPVNYNSSSNGSECFSEILDLRIKRTSVQTVFSDIDQSDGETERNEVVSMNLTELDSIISQYSSSFINSYDSHYKDLLDILK